MKSSFGTVQSLGAILLAWAAVPVLSAQNADTPPGQAKVLASLTQTCSHMGGGVAISPDGSSVAFIGSDNALHLLDVAANQQKLLTKQVQSRESNVPLDVFSDPSYSPDGTQILFVASGGTYYYPSDVFLIGKDGSGLKQLSISQELTPDQTPAVGHAGFSAYFGTPQFSPDGKTILLREYDALTGSSNVAIMNSDGSGLTTLSEGTPLGWSSDGNSIFVQRDGSAGRLDLNTRQFSPLNGFDAKIVGRLKHKDWFAAEGPVGLEWLNIQNGTATPAGSLPVPIALRNGQDLLRLKFIQSTSRRAVVQYQGDSVETVQVLQFGHPADGGSSDD